VYKLLHIYLLYMGCFYSKYHKVTTYEDLAEISVHDFISNLNNRKYLRSIESDRRCSGTPVILNIAKIRPDLIPHLMDKVQTKDNEFEIIDQSGKSFMDYVMSSDYNVRISILNKMKNNSGRKHYVKHMAQNGNPLEEVVEGNDLETFKSLYYGLTLRNMENVRVFGKTILEYAISEESKDLFDYLIGTEESGCNTFMRKFKNVSSKHKDILTLALVKGEHYVNGIAKLLCHCTGINFTNKYLFGKILCTKFDYACQVNYKHFVKICISNMLVPPSEIRRNIKFIVQIVSSHDLVNLIRDERIPIDVLEELDDDQNNVFMQSIINKTDLHSTLLDTGFLATSNIQHTNKRGENALMLSARFSPYTVIPILNNCLSIRNSIPILQRNINGEDFIDILYESSHDNELFYHIVDFGMMEQKDIIICKIVTLQPISLEEYIFIRYQQKLANERRNFEESTVDDTDCKICFTDDVDLETDCGHKFCLKCSMKLSRCPVCRNNISSYNFITEI